MVFRRFLIAFLAYCAIAVSLIGPSLIGHSSVTPEGFIDADPLYKHSTGHAKLLPFDDPTPITAELGREREVGSEVQRGRLATWNPWSGGGAPLWAEQGGPFFPTKLIYYVYPHGITFMAALAARLVVAALGLFYLARALGLSAHLSLVCGALFECSGFLAAELAFANSSAAYMLPWILLGAQRINTDRGLAAMASSGLVLGIASLGGHPSFTILAFLGFGVWLLGELARSRPPLRELVRLVGLALGAGVLALLVAAIGLLPFLELYSHGQSYKSADAGVAAWVDRLTFTRNIFAAALFVPSLVAGIRDTIPPSHWPLGAGASIGFVALVLGVAGARAWLEHWGMTLLAIIGLGMTLVPFGFKVIHLFPAMNYVLPWYCYALLTVPLCLSAGFGLRLMAQAPGSTPMLLLSLGIVLLGGVWVLVDLDPRFRPADQWTTFISPCAGLVAVFAYLMVRRSNAMRASAILGIFAVIEATAIRIPTIMHERSIVLRSGPSDATARLHGLLSNGSWRFVGIPFWSVGVPNTSLLFKLRDLRSNSALPTKRLNRFLDLAGARDNQSSDQYPPSLNLPVLSLAAVKYVVVSWVERQTVGTTHGLHELGTVGSIAFFENPLALARVRIAHDVIPVENDTQAFETLRRLIRTPTPPDAPEWARHTVIEGISPDVALRVGIPSIESGRGDSIGVVSEPDSETMMFEVKLMKPGFVVVADTFYPGWTATVDGVRTAIFPANLLFRAVYVPAGSHSIVMRYEPWSVRLGAGLTLLGLALVATLMWQGSPHRLPSTILRHDN